MKGISLALLLLIAGSFGTHAQLRVAIAAGGHVSEVKEENDLPDFDLLQNGYSGRTGAHFGFIADLRIAASKFYFQPGILLFNRGRKYADSVNTVNGKVYQLRKQFVNYIDFPLHFVYKAPMGKRSKFLIGAGPSLSFFYNGKESSESYGQNSFFFSEENDDLPVGDAPGKYKVLNLGANALAGVEFGKVFLTVNYSRGLNDFYRAVDYDGKFKHQAIGATLGIFIGKPVEDAPATRDNDKDGIPNDRDLCPDLAGTALTQGCPDTDADGIADREDNCPTEPGTAANKGCPVLDRDNDGVNDDKDKCPDTPGLARLDGCPVKDSDGDGVNDEDDKCPDVVGFGRYQGCPIPDTDGDGINDEEDQCPQVKGVASKKGCPEEIHREIVEKINLAARQIQFEFAKAELIPASLPVLDEVATLLREHPELSLSIEGHTSADGTYAANMKLSQARADRVKTYLEGKGIESGRLTARGFGPAKPLNSGRTEKEKAANRRVELKLSN